MSSPPYHPLANNSVATIQDSTSPVGTMMVSGSTNRKKEIANGEHQHCHIEEHVRPSSPTFAGTGNADKIKHAGDGGGDA